MIETSKDLKRYLQREKSLYLEDSVSGRLLQYATYDVKLQIYKFVRYLRYEEYHHNQKGMLHRLLLVYYRRKRNKLGIRLGLEMCNNTFDEGLLIYHTGNIVVNGMSQIGKNFKMHGDNCVGNNGKTLACPVIGDNVRLGVGAKVIGGVVLADNITVAAGAVVVHSFTEPGITVAGVPARKVTKGTR